MECLVDFTNQKCAKSSYDYIRYMKFTNEETIAFTYGISLNTKSSEKNRIINVIVMIWYNRNNI